MLSNPSQSLTIRVSNRTNTPCDLEQDKTLRPCMTLIEILICHWGWLNSTGSMQLRQVHACYPGIPEITGEHWGVFVCCEIMLSFVRSSIIPLLGRRMKHWCINLGSSTTARKMCFPSSRDCSSVSHAEQSIDSSFVHHHMAFCVILGRSTEMNGGWSWWLVSTSAPPGVWNSRLFPLNLI